MDNESQIPEGTVFKHYKGKLYRFRFIVRHSETMEELVVYETLYENPTGKLWVRPKKMFFETVQVSGQTVLRFERVSG